jgi:hypothetical protein
MPVDARTAKRIQSPPSNGQPPNGHTGTGRRALKRQKVPAQSRGIPKGDGDDGEEDGEPDDAGLHASPPEIAEDDNFHVDDDGANSEEFLLQGAGAKSDGAEDAEDDAQGDDDWYGSEAYKLISRPGSATVPGNRKLAVPQWILRYFRNIEVAVVFAQIVYWFGRSENRRRRAPRKDKQGRPVVDKTYRKLADEIGLDNERRIGMYLKAFKKDGLLDYYKIGMGAGRMTRIRLIPVGILNAYRIGCRRVEEAQR